MKIISVDAHNIIDYIYGVLAIAAPWLFGFAEGGTETYIFVAVGAAVILMALLTDYKYSAAKIIAYNTHLKIDMVLGIILAVSPWFFGFSHEVYIPHLVFGLFSTVVSMMSKKFVNYRAYN